MNYEENLVDELRSRKYYKKPSIVRKEEEKLRKKTRGGKVIRSRFSRFGARRPMTGSRSGTSTRK